MPSKSAMVKLKAIFIIDLIIIGAAAGAYFYLQDQGLVTGSVKPAVLTLTDLVIDPVEAYVGETVQISVNVTNSGGLVGNVTLNLEINNEIKSALNVTLPGNSSEIEEFTSVEDAAGIYNVQIGSLNGTFTIKETPPGLSKIVLSDLKVDPYEVWVNDTIDVTATTQNQASLSENQTQPDRLRIKVTVDDLVVDSQVILLDAGANQTVHFTVNATSEGKHTVKLNTLSGSFLVVKTGYHTLIINRSGGGSKTLPISFNGKPLGTPYIALLPVAEYTVSVPTPYDVGTGVVAFTSWSDGVASPQRTFMLDKRTVLVANYEIISGYASCPSLFIWNGTGYSYVTDVSNPGWLGYIGYITSGGQIVFSGGNPWDYVKLDRNVLTANNGNFDVTLAQQWDELYYLDSAYLMVVDHPIGTSVYTSMTNYLNKGSTGQVYTVSNGALMSTISAINQDGQNVLPQLLAKDGVFAPGINGNASPSWNNITSNKLTLDLGNLSNATQVKLVMTGMVDWGPAETYYAWINSFKEAAAQGLVSNGTEITPAPYMEIKDANGNWVRVSQDKQIPLPSDYNARTFTVDLTGLFPADVSDYQVRFTNFWNVTYDYIGIDTTPQQNVTIQKLNPTAATLGQWWETQSTASGAFTRYGDVTPLLQSADDMYVIGRQGDQVNMQFSTDNLAPVASGMERDYFFVVACWFKDPPGAWGYGFDFTVNPLPFMDMSGFPYPASESYPTDAAHLAYIQEYNTRIIPPP
jgi:hypothetical protein